MDRQKHKGRHDGEPEGLEAASFPEDGRAEYTVEPAWIDTAGRTRTWVMRDPSGARMAEIVTKRDAEKMAALLNGMAETPTDRDGPEKATGPALYREALEPPREPTLSDLRPPPASVDTAFRHDPKTSRPSEAIDKALDILAAQIDAGQSVAMTRYLMAMGRFHSYSWGNTLLIHVQRPDATHVAGFATWKKLGRSVRKGEKGILILAPCGGRKDTMPAEDGGGIEEDGIREHVRRFRAAYVFDISQTEGEALPEPERVRGDPGECLERLERFAREELGVTVEYVEHLGHALGVSMGGHVQVVKGLEDAQRFSVLCHEVAHEMLHWSAPEEVRKDKTLVETQAEAVAFVMCHAVGLNTSTAAADYISLYCGDKAVLCQSLGAIHRTAVLILEAVLT